METVIVAFENNKNALRVKEILEEDGAADCLVCRTADQVRRASRQFRMPVVVCGYKLGDQTAQLIFDDLPACAMLVLARQDVLELMDNDEIFRLPAPASRVDSAGFGTNVASGETSAGTAYPPAAQPGGTGAHQSGQGGADGPERHVGRTGPPLPPEKKYEQWGKIDTDSAAGAGRHPAEITVETRRSHGGSRESDCRCFHRRGA